MIASRALITGVTGFTGRYLAPLLAKRGYEVHGTSSRTCEYAGPCKLHTVDLCDREATQSVIARINPAVVVHLAAVSQVRDVESSDVYRTNIIGTQSLLDALCATRELPRSVLLASSANVYGNKTESVITESSSPDPTNDYAVSKIAMEQMARLYFARLPIVITRPFNYTGRGQRLDYVVPKIVDHVRRGERCISLGNTDVARDFSDVRMVVDVYARLVEVEMARGKIFNVCSGVAYTLSEVLAIVEEVTGRRLEVIVDPALVRPNEVRTLTGCSSALEGCIGPIRRYPLADTLAWMFSA